MPAFAFTTTSADRNDRAALRGGLPVPCPLPLPLPMLLWLTLWCNHENATATLHLNQACAKSGHVRLAPRRCLYASLVFAAGFVLGTVRTLWIAPALGHPLAVAAELPLMLAWSWVACGLAIAAPISRRWLPDGSSWEPPALTLILLAELLLAVTLGGVTPSEYAASYRTLPVQLGLRGKCCSHSCPSFTTVRISARTACT